MTDLVSIPGRDIVALLRAEAKRKPAIAELMDAASDMTDAEIDALKVPLPWYRKALKKCRDMQISSDTTARVSAIIANSVVEVKLNNVDGTMRRYTGDTQFISVARGGDVEIKSGTLIWFPMGGGVWVDTLFSASIDPRLGLSEYVGDIDRQGYINARAAQRAGNAPADIQGTVVDGVGPAESSVKPLFTIHRH
jgi:hypothetical protein